MKRSITPMPAADHDFGFFKIYYASTKFAIDNLKRIRVMLVGAGGGGLAKTAIGNDAITKHALGGAGGGFSMLDLDVKHGDVIEIIIGAGGTAGSVTPSAGSNKVVLPGDGGDTILKKNGIVIFSATGGKASKSTKDGFTLGSPGRGIGGEINKNGGSPGTIIDPKNMIDLLHGFATGGGASGTIYNTGGNGGDIDLTDSSISGTTTFSINGAATGGGGTGGPGGTIKAYSGQYNKYLASGGGGTGGGSATPSTPPNAWEGGQERILLSLIDGIPTILNPLIDINGRGESSAIVTDFFGAKTREAGAGAGTAGYVWFNENKYPDKAVFATNAKLFGGGGAAVTRTPPNLGHIYVTGGSGGIGGGGGGASTTSNLGATSTGTSCYGGAGGNGIAMLIVND